MGGEQISRSVADIYPNFGLEIPIQLAQIEKIYRRADHG